MLLQFVSSPDPLLGDGRLPERFSKIFDQRDRLLLRGDKEDRLALGLQLLEHHADLLEPFAGAGEIEHVDAALNAVQIRRHAGFHFFLAVPDVARGSEEFFFGRDSQHGNRVRVRSQDRKTPESSEPLIMSLSLTYHFHFA